MPNRREVRRKMATLENAVAQQRLEGLTPSAEVVLDLQRVVQGEISLSDVLENIGRRCRNGQVFHPGSLH